jgi:5'-3' exonuclease
MQAPGEAETELSKMSQCSVIDAVLSEDSDTIVFGAEIILRKIQ